MVKAAAATFSLQNLPIPSVIGNAGAQVQVAQNHRFSLEVTPFLHLRKQAGLRFLIKSTSLYRMLFSFFYQSKNQDCFCSSSVLFPLSLPSATAGVRKGRGC